MANSHESRNERFTLKDMLERMELAMSGRSGPCFTYSECRDLHAALSETEPRLYTGADLVPSSWLDPLLTGPDKVLHGEPGTWGCPEIETLLNAIRERIQRADGIKTVTEHLNGK